MKKAKKAAKKKAPSKKSGRAKFKPPEERELTQQEQMWEKRVMCAYLFMITKKPTQEAIAPKVGVVPRTIRLWMADTETWEKTRAEARKRWISNASDAARAAVFVSLEAGNATLGFEFLSRVDDELAPKSKHEHTGKGGGPIESKSIPVDDMSDTDLARLALKLAQELAK